MDITRRSTPKSDWYILCSQRWRSSIQSAKTRLRADCGSDHELLIAKFRLKLTKVGKTTRPFRYDLNQIPYDYTVEVRNRFKGLDLIECLINYGQRFMTLYRKQDQDHPQEKEMQKSKMDVWGGIQIAVKRREAKAKEKRNSIPIWMQSSKEQQGEIRKPSSVISAKK